MKKINPLKQRKLKFDLILSALLVLCFLWGLVGYADGYFGFTGFVLWMLFNTFFLFLYYKHIVCSLGKKIKDALPKEDEFGQATLPAEADIEQGLRETRFFEYLLLTNFLLSTCLFLLILPKIFGWFLFTAIVSLFLLLFALRSRAENSVHKYILLYLMSWATLFSWGLSVCVYWAWQISQRQHSFEERILTKLVGDEKAEPILTKSLRNRMENGWKTIEAKLAKLDDIGFDQGIQNAQKQISQYTIELRERNSLFPRFINHLYQAGLKFLKRCRATGSTSFSPPTEPQGLSDLANGSTSPPGSPPEPTLKILGAWYYVAHSAESVKTQLIQVLQEAEVEGNQFRIENVKSDRIQTSIDVPKDKTLLLRRGVRRECIRIFSYNKESSLVRCTATFSFWQEWVLRILYPLLWLIPLRLIGGRSLGILYYILCIIACWVIFAIFYDLDYSLRRGWEQTKRALFFRGQNSVLVDTVELSNGLPNWDLLFLPLWPIIMILPPLAGRDWGFVQSWLDSSVGRALLLVGLFSVGVYCFFLFSPLLAARFNRRFYVITIAIIWAAFLNTPVIAEFFYQMAPEYLDLTTKNLLRGGYAFSGLRCSFAGLLGFLMLFSFPLFAISPLLMPRPQEVLLAKLRAENASAFSQLSRAFRIKRPVFDSCVYLCLFLIYFAILHGFAISVVFFLTHFAKLDLNQIFGIRLWQFECPKLFVRILDHSLLLLFAPWERTIDLEKIRNILIFPYALSILLIFSLQVARYLRYRHERAKKADKPTEMEKILNTEEIELFDRICKGVRIKRPRIYRDFEIQTPDSMSLKSGVSIIRIPASLCAGGQRKERMALLAHEVYHIAKCHLKASWLQRVSIGLGMGPNFLPSLRDSYQMEFAADEFAYRVVEKEPGYSGAMLNALKQLHKHTKAAEALYRIQMGEQIDADSSILSQRSRGRRISRIRFLLRFLTKPENAEYYYPPLLLRIKRLEDTEKFC